MYRYIEGPEISSYGLRYSHLSSCSDVGLPVIELYIPISE